MRDSNLHEKPREKQLVADQAAENRRTKRRREAGSDQVASSSRGPSVALQTEQNIRHALRIVDAMAPAVAYLDECDKAFSGASGLGSNDHEVTSVRS